MHSLVWKIIAFVGSLFMVSVGTADEPPKVPRVLVIGIDGLRPDSLKIAKTPNLDRLITDGILIEGTDIRGSKSTTKADTVSGPGWSNILTGVWPDKHNVLTNDFSEPRYNRYPHVFSRLREANPDAVTASFSTWAPIAEKIVASASVNENVSDDGNDYRKWDEKVTNRCVDYLSDSNPDIVFWYQGQVDEMGHAHGFHPSVKAYTTAIETVDGNVAKVIDAIRARSSAGREDWLIIVCTDHGGIGTGHGGGHQQPEVRTTFLILSGAAVDPQAQHDKTYQVDIVPTALAHLKIPVDANWQLDGQPVGLLKD